MNYKQDAIAIFNAGIASVHPSVLIPKHIAFKDDELYISGKRVDRQTGSKIYVLGAGKASASMAESVEKIMGDKITGGIIITKYGHTLPLTKIRIMEAAHPVPDENSVKAGMEITRLSNSFQKEDIIIFLLSGGASSLMADYPANSSLKDLQQVFDLLLKSGATIDEMNTVRKHLSGIKGGQLSRNIFPAKLFTLILSDVMGDQPDVIGSGPTVPDTGSFEDAEKTIRKYDLFHQLPPTIVNYLEKGGRGEMADTPKKDDPCFEFMEYAIIGNNRIALQAAEKKAIESGYATTIVTDKLSGEAKIIGAMLIKQALAYTGPLPACFLYGGETTVTIKGNGLGGRNQELALAAGMAFPEGGNITFLSGGTDGTDGPTDAAGAVVDFAMMKKATGKGLKAMDFLNQNNSYYFFEAIDGLIKTGPTQTNVMDIVIVLVH